MTIPFEKVLVTGGSGRLGRYVVDELAGRCEVTVLDRVAPRRDVPYAAGDIVDLACVHEAAAGMDAVVHLAAIPNPRDAPPEVVFHTNVQGTWNVLHAAYEAGVAKVVLCSSECATGLCYGGRGKAPDYLPVDEAHPLRPEDPYSLSKQLGEMAGQGFARRGGMEVVVLRPTLVLFPEQRDEVPERQDLLHADLWAYVEPGDVARAFRLALEYRGPAFDLFFISAADTLSPRPTLALVEERFGTLPALRRPALYEADPCAAIYDIAHAREALGFEPRSDWRAFAAEEA